MSPKKSYPHEQQGALFNEEIIVGGATDPELYSTATEFTPAPEGVYPETTETIQDPEGEAVVEAVRQAAAIIKNNRHVAQVGKHSPLERDGSYENIQAGDFLKDFGPVTYRNFEDAKRHAAQLEQQRRSRRP